MNLSVITWCVESGVLNEVEYVERWSDMRFQDWCLTPLPLLIMNHPVDFFTSCLVFSALFTVLRVVASDYSVFGVLPVPTRDHIMCITWSGQSTQICQVCFRADVCARLSVHERAQEGSRICVWVCVCCLFVQSCRRGQRHLMFPRHCLFYLMQWWQLVTAGIHMLHVCIICHAAQSKH